MTKVPNSPYAAGTIQAANEGRQLNATFQSIISGQPGFTNLFDSSFFTQYATGVDANLRDQAIAINNGRTSAFATGGYTAFNDLNAKLFPTALEVVDRSQPLPTALEVVDRSQPLPTKSPDITIPTVTQEQPPEVARTTKNTSKYGLLAIIAILGGAILLTGGKSKKR